MRVMQAVLLAARDMEQWTRLVRSAGISAD